jgi:hypothetical protein
MPIAVAVMVKLAVGVPVPVAVPLEIDVSDPVDVEVALASETAPFGSVRSLRPPQPMSALRSATRRT